MSVRKSRLLLVVASLVFTACGRSSPPVNASSAPVALPEVSVEPLAGGGAVSIGQVTKGRVTVIDLWASWCTACRDVSKQVDQLAQQKKGTDLVVVGLDVGEDRATVASFLADKKPTYDIYLDAAFALPDALGQRELPAVIVVDREGVVRMVRKKVDPEMTKLVDDLLAAPAPR